MPPTPNTRQRAKLRAGQQTKCYRIENLGGSTATIYLYEEIGYWGTSAADFVEDLSELVGVTAIDLHVNSPGGEVFDGLAIANCLRAHPATVTVYVDGLAASIASVIAMAGDRIVMGPHSQLMIHEGSGCCIGDAAEMRRMADLLDFQSNNIAGVYAARAGGDVAAWRALMTAETWFSAEEAVAAGLADEVAQSPTTAAPAPAAPDMGNSWDLSVFRYAGREQAPAPTAPAGERTAPRASGVPAGQMLTAAISATPPPATAAATLRLEISGEQLGELLIDPLRRAVAARAATPVVDTAAPVHHTATVDNAWDGGVAEKRLPSPMTVATAKKAYGWYDSAQVDGGEIVKAGCKLPHHEVSADGTPGAANLAGVRNALSRLPQSDIPEGERAAVERHLQAHLDDADQTSDRAVTGLPPDPATPSPDPATAAAAAPEPAAAPVASVNAPTTNPVNPPADPPATADDPWAALTARITSKPSADDEFARLKEALL